MHRHSFTRWIRLTYYLLTHCTDYKVSHFLLSLGSFFSKELFFFTLPYIYIPSTLPPMPSRPDHPAQPSLYTPTRGGIREISSGIVRQPIEVRRGFTRQTSTPSALQIPFYKAYRRLRYKRDTHTSGVGQRRAYAHYHRALYSA